MRIAAPAGFSFQHTVESHGWYLLAPFRWSRTEKVLRRPELLDEQVVELEVRCRRGSIEVTASSTGI
ncbi:MAG: hypothetical protein ACXW28_14880, partial [Thermoanaerobaculia bacterium]